MKFLIQIPQLIFGGAEKVLVPFSTSLVEHGHDVEILEIYERGLLRDQFDSRITFSAICSHDYTRKYYASLDDIKKERRIIHKLTKCAKLCFSKVVGYRRFAERLAAHKYKSKYFDVAINYLETDTPGFILRHIKADKYLQWIHTDVKNMPDVHMLDKYIPLFKQMDAIICVAESAKQAFMEAYPELSPKTHMLYNFYDTDTIIEQSHMPFHFNTTKPVLLSVGRMTPQKSYLRFLRVLARLKQEGYSFSWHILGDGAQRVEIEKRILELQLSNYVSLDGLTENPYKYMAACDLFVLPSMCEGFPTVIVEAKVLHKPVLATDVSGIREQIIDGVTGLIVDNDEDGIYRGLKQLIISPELRDKLSVNNGVSSIFDNENKYQRFMKIISDSDTVK